MIFSNFAINRIMKIEDSYGRYLTESQMTNDSEEIAQNFSYGKTEWKVPQCFSMWQF